jgi:hypothetical protein
MEELITPELIAANLEKWEQFSNLLIKRIDAARNIISKASKEELYKKIRKERKRMDKLYGAPMNVGEGDWFDWLKDSNNWDRVNYLMDKKRKCVEESCSNTVDIGKLSTKDFYRANGDDEYLLCEKCFNQRDKDDNIIWALREAKYYEETEHDKNERARDPKEWYKDEEEGSEISCVLKETCWYQGNSDRLKAYGTIYVLRGTDRGIIICDICYQNGQFKNLSRRLS